MGKYFSRRPVSKIYFYLSDLIKGLFTSKALKEYLINQKLPKSELISRQDQAVSLITQYAYGEISGYQSMIGDSSVTSFDDLPILEKSQLLSSPENFISKKIRPIFYGSTSGSTGTSLRFAYDTAHASRAEASKLRGRAWYKVRRADPVLVLWGRPLIKSNIRKKIIDPLKSYLRNEVHFNTFESLDENFMSKVVTGIQRHKPKVIYGYGSSLASLARYLDENDINIASDLDSMLIQYTADHLGTKDAGLLTQYLGARVVSDYGASEAPGIAFECCEGYLHISIDCYKIEFLDSLGAEVSDGETGNIVVTSLYNRAMPLIRYKIGDLGEPIPGTCSCGNFMPRMRLAVGKSIDTISTSFAKGISAHYLDYINIELMRRGCKDINQFKLIQYGIDDFRLLIVSDKLVPSDSSRDFLDMLRDKLGPVRVQVEFVKVIPRETSGKHSYFSKLEG